VLEILPIFIACICKKIKHYNEQHWHLSVSSFDSHINNFTDFTLSCKCKYKGIINIKIMEEIK